MMDEYNVYTKLEITFKFQNFYVIVFQVLAIIFFNYPYKHRTQSSMAASRRNSLKILVFQNFFSFLRVKCLLSQMKVS